ncbi:MAG: flagellar filament capping protein FliD [Gracilibacteraceae bacterium]|jgi:flagellar hook-associated protein 2|nr:flagellar filament capping protein FliD [Gracilibacteraceae bacterium]
MFSSVSGTSNATSSSSSVSKGIGGLASGLDTDELVTQLTSATSNRIDKQLQERQKVVWKQEAYRTVTTALQDFSSKYFSSSSALNIMSASFFEQYTLQSSSSKVALSGDLGKANNVQIVSIDQLAAKAQASFDVSKKITSEIDVNKLIDSSNAGKKITLYLDGTLKELTLNAAGSTNTDQILADFNDQLKDAFGTYDGSRQAVKANVSGGPGAWSLEVEVADPSSVFAVHAADPGVLGTGGVFKDLLPNMMNKHSINDALSDFGVAGPQSLEINGVSINVADDTTTLASLMRQVNSSGAGVTMSFSQASGQLTLVSNNSGATEAIKISGSPLAAALFGTKAGGGSSGITSTSAAIEVARGQNARAEISVNGATMLVERANNSIDIDGLVIEFKDTLAAADGPITFSASLDTEAVTARVKEFIEQYNAVVKLINDQVLTRPDRNYQPLTDAQKKEMSDREIELYETKAKAGLLYADSTLSGIVSSMRVALYSVTQGVSAVMGEIGIQTADYKKHGQLDFDETKFRTALADDPEKIKSLFTTQSTVAYNPEAAYADVEKRFNESGFAARISDILQRAATTSNPKGSLLEIAGITGDRTDTSNRLTTQLASIDTKIIQLQAKLAKERQRYWNQFTALEKYIQQMNTQSTALFGDYSSQ